MSSTTALRAPTPPPPPSDTVDNSTSWETALRRNNPAFSISNDSNSNNSISAAARRNHPAPRPAQQHHNAPAVASVTPSQRALKNALNAAEKRPRAKRTRFSARPPPAPLYMPPFVAARVRRTGRLTERECAEHTQRDAWLRMRRCVIGVVNKVNANNIRHCATTLFACNLIRAQGVFAKALLNAQRASPHFSQLYAALVAVVNTRMPQVARLVVARLLVQLAEAYAAQDRNDCFASVRMLAHLYNQQVVDNTSVLQLALMCLTDPSNGSVQLAALAVRECGHFMAFREPHAMEMIFSRLRDVLHNDHIDNRTQVLVEQVMKLRREKFKLEPALPAELDLVEHDDVIVHNVFLDTAEEEQTMHHLNDFTFDPMYSENEKRYAHIRYILLGPDAHPSKTRHDLDSSNETSAEVSVEGTVDATPTKESRHSASEDAERDNASAKVSSSAPMEDMTESKLITFRRTVYLKIMSSASYEECAHKLSRFMSSHKGMENELCNMIVECCSQEKTYLRTYGLLGQRMCFLSTLYITGFEENFARVYANIHRLDTRKIRNIASFYASLLVSEALSWRLLQVVHLVKEETTASSRIFLKVLFQEVATTLGSERTRNLFASKEMAPCLQTVFPRDNAANSRFAINFFTNIGLGYVTDELREHLKNMPATAALPAHVADRVAENHDSSSVLSSSSQSSSVLSESSDESDDSHRRDDPQNEQKRDEARMSTDEAGELYYRQTRSPREREESGTKREKHSRVEETSPPHEPQVMRDDDKHERELAAGDSNPRDQSARDSRTSRDRSSRGGAQSAALSDRYRPSRGSARTQPISPERMSRYRREGERKAADYEDGHSRASSRDRRDLSYYKRRRPRESSDPSRRTRSYSSSPSPGRDERRQSTREYWKNPSDSSDYNSYRRKSRRRRSSKRQRRSRARSRSKSASSYGSSSESQSSSEPHGTPRRRFTSDRTERSRDRRREEIEFSPQGRRNERRFRHSHSGKRSRSPESSDSWDGYRRRPAKSRRESVASSKSSPAASSSRRYSSRSHYGPSGADDASR